jgi:hypothetical protein
MRRNLKLQPGYNYSQLHDDKYEQWREREREREREAKVRSRKK